jgi:ATP-dependent Zn protease
MTERPSWSKYLFPLVIVAAVVWLALQTLGGSSDKTFRFSQALTTARQNPSSISRVTFHPSNQEVEFHFTNGTTRTTVYPVEASAFDLQQLLDKNHIAFEAKSTRSSPLWSILTSLLPFVLLFGFWIFLMRTVQQKKQTEPTPTRTPF